MSFDPADGLTDELADAIRRELELEPALAHRDVAFARRAQDPDDDRTVELVLHDEDPNHGEEDVATTLTPAQARELAAVLLELAG